MNKKKNVVEMKTGMGHNQDTDRIGLVGTFTKLTMKSGGPDSLTFWIDDPQNELESLSKLCGQEFAAKNLFSELISLNGKARTPGSADIFSLDFAGIRDQTLFVKSGVRLGDVYFDVKDGKEGKEYSASIVFDVPEMGKEFYELCRFCELGQKIWIKITKPQGEMFKEPT